MSRCLTCGATIDRASADLGRRRRYCDAKCRQRGHRLRQQLGTDWIAVQPWRVVADAEAARLDAAQRQAQAQREAALRLMSPDARQRLLAGEQRAWTAQADLMLRKIARLQRQIDASRRLTSAQVSALARGEDMSMPLDPCDDDRVVKLLNLAVVTDSSAEATAFFAKARSIWRG